MRKALWHLELVAIAGGQFEALPTQECRRRLAQVDDDVPDAAPQASNQLDLSMRRTLKMHAADGAPGRSERLAVLGVASVEPRGSELLAAETAFKPTALVLERNRFDPDGVLQKRLAEKH